MCFKTISAKFTEWTDGFRKSIQDEVDKIDVYPPVEDRKDK